jgi:ribosomal biogenesis protein LAS1
MDGAYLIWVDLLTTILYELPRFIPALVASLLQSLTAVTALDPAQDADKEALAMWILHVMKNDEFFSGGWNDRATVLAEVMKWCCLYPGCWTQYIGRELLKECGEFIKAEWEDLFEASLIRARDDSTEEVLPGAASGSTSHVVAEGADMQDGTMDNAGGWSRAIAPMSVPIGVVQ